jgi:hypothetical protein
MLYKSFFISQDSQYPASSVGSGILLRCGIPVIPVGDDVKERKPVRAKL